MMLALLMYAYANGIFSSRRIERASHRDVGVRFVAVSTHRTGPPWRKRHGGPITTAHHDMIVTPRREDKAAIEAAFLQVLLLAQETVLLKVGNVSIDGTKIDANAARAKSLRYDRAKDQRETLKADIAALMAQAAVAEGADPKAWPAEIARRESLIAKAARRPSIAAAGGGDQRRDRRPHWPRRAPVRDRPGRCPRGRRSG
jgi:transposase